MNTYSRSRTSSNRPLVLKALVLAVAILVNLVLAARLAWGPQSVLAYRELKNQHTELLEKLSYLNTSNATLSAQIRLLQEDDNYVEKVIRQQLNFVRDNEILYLFDDGQSSSGAATDDGKN